MFNRISVSALLQSIICLLAGTVVVTLGCGVWNSWTKLRESDSIASNAEASFQAFTAMHNLRSDRVFSIRALKSATESNFNARAKAARSAEIPAIKATISAIQKIDEFRHDPVIATLDSYLQKLTALHQESDSAIAMPKAQRRPSLADDYLRSVSELMDLLDKLSSRLTLAVKLQDSYVGQLMQLKQLGVTLRNAAGDSAALLVNSFVAAPRPDVLERFFADLSRARTAFFTIQEFSAGLPLPAYFTEAVRRAKSEYFDSDYTVQQVSVLRANLAGTKSAGDDPAAWDQRSIDKHAMLLQIANDALEAAKDYSRELRYSAQQDLLVQFGLLIVALSVGIGSILVIRQRITNPLLKISGVLTHIAGGDFRMSLQSEKRNDEIGQIVFAVNTMIAQVSSTIGTIKVSAREVTNASSEIALATTDLSQRTEEQAAGLEETTASMHEISATIHKNTQSAEKAKESVLSTQVIANRGGDVATQAVEAMSRIEESSKEIADIIGVIDDIARQTNLLALNAAVEAARAGEAGRGFAVVATEVRSLAQRSSQAAKDIADLITNSGGQVKEGVQLVNQAGAALEQIVASIREVASLVSDIAAASAAQAVSVAEVSKALSQMDEVTQRNSALVEENAATAQALDGQAQTMNEQVGFFRISDVAEPIPPVANRSSRCAPNKSKTTPIIWAHAS